MQITRIDKIEYIISLDHTNFFFEIKDKNKTKEIIYTMNGKYYGDKTHFEVEKFLRSKEQEWRK